MSEATPPVRATGLERHIQTGVAIVLVGLVGWVGLTVTGNREQIARLDERVDNLVQAFARVDARLDGRYQATEAKRDFAERDRRLDALDTRVRELEGRR